MRLFAIERLDKYARGRVAQGSKAWALQRTLADETQARLVGTMMIRLEAEYGVSHASFFLNQNGGKDAENQKRETTEEKQRS